MSLNIIITFNLDITIFIMFTVIIKEKLSYEISLSYRPVPKVFFKML